jgi:hypothetical protein
VGIPPKFHIKGFRESPITDWKITAIVEKATVFTFWGGGMFTVSEKNVCSRFIFHVAFQETSVKNTSTNLRISIWKKFGHQLNGKRFPLQNVTSKTSFVTKRHQ